MLFRRVAIVTGGARGIGRAISLRFARARSCVVVADIREEEGAATARETESVGGQGLYVRCDISKYNQIEHVIDETLGHFGRIDILVNNAGILGKMKSITDMSEEEWDRMLDINLKAPFLFSKAVAEHMKNQRRGRIINISSLGALFPHGPQAAYSSSKSGLIGLTADLAAELAPFNVCVNVILPGAIRTGIWSDVQTIPDEEIFFDRIGKNSVPLGRIGMPEDVANAAFFLASDLSSFVTGSRIDVGGGFPLHVQKKGH